MARARLIRGQRGIGIEVIVGAQDLGEVLVDDHGTVHLGELEEAVGREGDIEGEAIGARGEDGILIADGDQGTEMAGNDHVDGHAQRRAGSAHANSLLATLFGAQRILLGILGVHGLLF